MKTILLTLMLTVITTASFSQNNDLRMSMLEQDVKDINLRLDSFRKNHEAFLLLTLIGGATAAISASQNNPNEGITAIGLAVAGIGSVGMMLAPTELNKKKKLIIFNRKSPLAYYTH